MVERIVAESDDFLSRNPIIISPLEINTGSTAEQMYLVRNSEESVSCRVFPATHLKKGYSTLQGHYRVEWKASPAFNYFDGVYFCEGSHHMKLSNIAMAKAERVFFFLIGEKKDALDDDIPILWDCRGLKYMPPDLIANDVWPLLEAFFWRRQARRTCRYAPSRVSPSCIRACACQWSSVLVKEENDKDTLQILIFPLPPTWEESPSREPETQSSSQRGGFH
ncbi:hypothetical protein BDZ97DRAFT_1764975 [Flammula alnicola]|nr:hypothetical protein BDZ97DRAFT_1764975 [Flammula alnicola]